MPIQRLSVQLANQIAAGEVVERPSSVVKELMENAIDAKATSITLEIAKAGKSLIKVTDNGSGIPKSELVLALAPHATSKISKLEDLDAIYTLGFRGEALASIASVSKLTLISCTKEQDHAFQVEVSGPEQNPDVQPAAHPVGTSVVVRELFFNTPARRRFLKSDKTEFNHIKELFTKLALVNFGIEFKFIADGKVVIHVPAIKKEDISLRIGKLLGVEFKQDGMYFDSTQRTAAAPVAADTTGGANSTSAGTGSSASTASTDTSLDDFANTDADDLEDNELPNLDLEELAAADPVIKMFGVILPPPSLTQSMPDRLLTFLNGRMIADKMVNHAIKEGYMESILQPQDNFKPCVRAVIFLECDPHIVDVNVHPRKDEVRFHNSNLIHESIKQEVLAVLEAYGLNQQRANQGMLAPSLVVDQDMLESKLEVKPTAVEQAQQRLENWQQQAMQAQRSFAYGENLHKNQALQDLIAGYFADHPQALRRVPAEAAHGTLPGRLCELSRVRTVMVELEARRQAQRAYDRYHQRLYGMPAQVTQKAQQFMDQAHPILKSDLEALRRQGEQTAGAPLVPAPEATPIELDEQGMLKHGFSLDDEDYGSDPTGHTGRTSHTSEPAPLQNQSQVVPQGTAQVAPQATPQAISQGVQGRLSAPYSEQLGSAVDSAFVTETAHHAASAESVIEPQRGYGADLLAGLDPKTFLGSGPNSPEGAQILQQRYNQHMLGMHTLQTAPAAGTQGGTPAPQPKLNLSELLVPAGTGSAFNQACTILGDVRTLVSQETGLKLTNSSSFLDPMVLGKAVLNSGAKIEQDDGQAEPLQCAPAKDLIVRSADDNWTSAQLQAALAGFAGADGVKPLFPVEQISGQTMHTVQDLSGEALAGAGADSAAGAPAGTAAGTPAGNPTGAPVGAESGADKGTGEPVSILDYHPQSQFLSLVAHDVLLFKLEHRYYVGRGSELYYSFAARNYVRQVQQNAVDCFTLQMNFAIKCESALLQELKNEVVQQAYQRCGFKLEVNGQRSCIEVKQIPLLLVSTDLARLVPAVLSRIVQEAVQINMGSVTEQIGQEIARARKFEIATEADAKLLLSKIDSLELLQNVRHSSDIKELKLLNLALSMLHGGDGA